METSSATSSRPQHCRNASSKSNGFKALVTPRQRPEHLTASPPKQRSDGDDRSWLSSKQLQASKTTVLGERQRNMQSPPGSPSKLRSSKLVSSTTCNDVTVASNINSLLGTTTAMPKKSKSSANLAGMFGLKSRPNREQSRSAPKDKENTTPPSSSDGQVDTPIWSQFATTTKSQDCPGTSENEASQGLEDEIAKYTPREYSPSQQRNFNGGFEQPQLRPGLQSRPRSMYLAGAEVTSALNGRPSGDKGVTLARKSEDSARQKSSRSPRDPSVETSPVRQDTDRVLSNGSMEQGTNKGKLTIAKRGGRVMAAVAALQSKSKEPDPTSKPDSPLDPKAVDEAFEAVLDSRNVPEPMRRKMRSLTLRVKADFVKQNSEASRTDRNSPTNVCSHSNVSGNSNGLIVASTEEVRQIDDDSRSTKRSRARSRTFTFSKGDKGGQTSPSKRQRSSSKVRSRSRQRSADVDAATPITPCGSLDKRRSGAPVIPADYIKYLRSNQQPVSVEVGRLHKLRILLRNETVAWVDAFISLDGMSEIVGLLNRIMELEWREEHEDQLLHETLLCLKGLCTTQKAMDELEKVADELFPKLMAMLFDDEKKGPAEYSTRAIIVTVLFNHLTAVTTCSPEVLEKRARTILGYLGDPVKPEDAKPVEFILDMRIARPYKLWSREVTHVTKEVFWIFLHHLNVVPLPKANETFPSVSDESGADERAEVLAATYTQRHFPGTRPPVPAAPYIGGVEWDATTYITAHLDLLNGLIASIPTSAARNALRAEMQASGIEKLLGATLRTCKEKFYAGVHDGLRAWVAAAAEDGWETRYVREGPTQEEQARGYSPKKSPKKKDVAPKLEVQIAVEKQSNDVGGDDGWLG